MLFGFKIMENLVTLGNRVRGDTSRASAGWSSYGSCFQVITSLVNIVFSPTHGSSSKSDPFRMNVLDATNWS